MKKRYAALLIIAAIGCSYASYHHWQYSPHLNSHPKYFMHIRGDIAPALRDKIQLKFVATYATTNPKCRVFVNMLEGVRGDRYLTKNFQAIIAANGTYKLNIPLDYYNQGMCAWHISDIKYQFPKQKWLETVASFTNTHKQLGTAGVVLKCTEKLNCDYYSNKFYRGELSYFGNYLYNLRLEAKNHA